MNTKYKLNLDNYAELEKTLEDQKNAYLESNDELVKNLIFKRKSGLILVLLPIMFLVYYLDIKIEKIVFEILKNPYLPKDCLVKLAEVKQQYTNEELYQLWLILKHLIAQRAFLRRSVI